MAIESGKERCMNVLKGALAGAIGGVVGGAVKLGCEAIVPPRPPGREPPPGILAANVLRGLTGRELSKDERATAAMGAHWLFSFVSGALHGALVESQPALEDSQGIPLGLAVWVSMHEILLPLAHATPPLKELPISEQVNECITHCIFGFTVERTRRILRPLF